MSLITGISAADEYARRFGHTEKIDQDLASLIHDGLIYFDTEKEIFSLTDAGHEAFNNDRVNQWQEITDMTLEDWDIPDSVN